MQANVDVSSLVVRCGEASWPFRLDLDRGTASIELHDCAYEVSPLTWRAKMRLARFAPMDQAFVQTRFLEACLLKPKILPTEKRDEAVLLALATWINLSSGEAAGLPLDQDQLASVTVEVCRALHVGPMAFAELSAAEVEILWQNMDRQPAADEFLDLPVSMRSPQASHPVHAPEPQFDTKIVIVPDQTQVADVPPGDANETNLQVDDSGSLQPDIGDVSLPVTEQVSNETLPSKRNAVRLDRDATARFRVSIDEPIPKTSRQPAATFRVPLKQPRRSTLFQSGRPEEVLSESLMVGDADSFKRSTILEIPPDVGTPTMALTTSRVAPRVASTTPSASRWPELEEREETALVPRAEDREWMLEEFCERLAEAAADLGILEEV